jgi:hypothetical protein
MPRCAPWVRLLALLPARLPASRQQRRVRPCPSMPALPGLVLHPASLTLHLILLPLTLCPSESFYAHPADEIYVWEGMREAMVCKYNESESNKRRWVGDTSAAAACR